MDNPSLNALRTILSLLGNIDHSVGNGPNSAKMRGDKLNDIRLIAQEGITLTEQAGEDAASDAQGEATFNDTGD